MKRILLIIAFLCVGVAFAQFAEAPQYEFSSTSSYKYTEYNYSHTVPVSELQKPFSAPAPQYSPRRSSGPGYPPEDPFMENTPVGDPDIFIILILLFSYFYMKKRRQQFLLYTGIKR